MDYRYPFGRLVTNRKPVIFPDVKCFILGAYPSAVHIAWRPSSNLGIRPIKALPVDDEPIPFWDGTNQHIIINKWKEKVGWKRDWGEASPIKFNGSSGRELDEHYLKPLNIRREQCCISDCLDMYHASEGVMACIEETGFEKFAMKYNLPKARFLQHPDEKDIVRESLQERNVVRLKTEISDSGAKCIITLGNAALQVVQHMLSGTCGQQSIGQDSASYGRNIKIDGFVVTPLKHPGQKHCKYKELHKKWIESRQNVPRD